MLSPLQGVTLELRETPLVDNVTVNVVFCAATKLAEGDAIVYVSAPIVNIKSLNLDPGKRTKLPRILASLSVVFNVSLTVAVHVAGTAGSTAANVPVEISMVAVLLSTEMEMLLSTSSCVNDASLMTLISNKDNA